MAIHHNLKTFLEINPPKKVETQRKDKILETQALNQKNKIREPKVRIRVKATEKIKSKVEFRINPIKTLNRINKIRASLTT